MTLMRGPGRIATVINRLFCTTADDRLRNYFRKHAIDNLGEDYVVRVEHPEKGQEPPSIIKSVSKLDD